MYRYLKYYIAFLITLTSCQGNFLKDVSNKTSSEALYEDAIKLMDENLFNDAFTKMSTIETTDPTFALSDKFKKTKAGIQAGQCGLTFISFVDGLTHAAAGGAFTTLMGAFKGLAVLPQKCADAQATMLGLSSVDDDQLLFLAVLGMAKVGVNLRDKADRDGTGSLGDGTEDASFDICDSTAAADRLSDADLKQVITGLGLTLQNFALIGGSFSGSSAEASLTAMQAFCDDPAGDGTGAGHDADKINCQLTDVNSAAISPQLLRTFRRILKTHDQGLDPASPGCSLNPVDPGYCCPALATP